MAKKARKKTALKKTAASARGKTNKSKTKKSKTARKSTLKPKARRKVKAKSPSLGQRLSNAYHTVVDTMTGTGALRNKLEKPGTSESE
jgi:NAD(P)H-hydrate repair Nnr-like enzyme with NAD(P)H-hydrate epimerase domain